MDISIRRDNINNILSKEHEYIPKKTKRRLSQEDSVNESMNKYNSDEEGSLSSSEESQEGILDMEVEQEAKKEENPLKTLTQKSSQLLFDSSLFKFTDSSLINEINAITSQQALTKFLGNFQNKITFDSIDYSNFYSALFSFLLQKIFIMIKQNSGIFTDIQHSFSFISRISTKILNNNITYLVATSEFQKENLEEEKNDKKRYEANFQYSLEICDFCIELYLLILSANNINQPSDFISVSLNYLVEIINKKDYKLTQNANSNVKKYIETIHQLCTNLKHFSISFSLEEYKNIFSLCFNLLKFHDFSNVFLFVIDIICHVIEITDDVSFINKFIENILVTFDDFLSCHESGSEKYKYYILNKTTIKHYYSYFGEYKCYNSDSICLFSYLFLRFCSLIYLREDFLTHFEKFLIKLFEWTRPNILLCLHCLLVDLLKIKYNVEFCVSLIVLTNFYLSFSNFISQNELEIGKKKFFIHLLELFLEDLLKDFTYLKKCYLCFGIKQNVIKRRGKKEKKGCKINYTYIGSKDSCGCFCCCFSDVLYLKKEYFDCSECHSKTNLRLQLIDPDKDDNTSVCGFCNMKSFFESCGIVFEKENDLKLIDTNEDLIEEFSKVKKIKEEKEDNENKEESKKKSSRNLFDKFIFYQDLLYKNAFLFLKINLLNFIRISNKIENKTMLNNIDNSVKIFLKNLITDQKMKNATYQNFTQSVIQFYTVQKERMFNLQQDIQIDDDTIQFFFFYHFYVNFLFAGHWKIIDLILNKHTYWAIKYKCMKILEKYILFEGEDEIFQNFNVNIIAPLLCDSSSNIREFAFNILFKLYQNGKIQRGTLIYILYENINESSFLIRKRIVIALSDLVIKEKERENLKTIIMIFLNKMTDNSESEKIKKIIYDFFVYCLNSTKMTKSKGRTTTITELLYQTLDIFIEILKETEDLLTGSNPIAESLVKLFEIISPQVSSFNISIDYLIQKYIFIENVNNYDLIQALNLLKIFSSYQPNDVLVYIDYISMYLAYKNENQPTVANKVVQLSCEILDNLFSDLEEENINIKSHLVSKIEACLLYIILNKPIFVMISSIKTYFSMFKRGMVTIDKIKSLALQNFNFLNQKRIDKKIPLGVYSKSLSLLSFLVYCLPDEQILEIYRLCDFFGENAELKTISDSLYEIFSFYTLYDKKITSVNFRAFESFGFFWIKYPEYLSKSKKEIDFIMNHLEQEEEKIILLRTFFNFFSKVSSICKENQKKQIENEGASEKVFDFGRLHLFFDSFINKFSSFLVEEKNAVIRTSTIHLLRLIVDLGNINVHSILPQVFPALFDLNNEIRYSTACLLEKVIRISKEKFFVMMKEMLKNVYTFQKTNFVDVKYINSFVKEREEGEIINTNENVFDLLNYKVKKILNDDISNNFLEKFVAIFNDVSTIESQFSSSSMSGIRDCLEKFEFYEFVGKLIGDFKFQKRQDVFYVFNNAYIEYETNLCVFKSKIKKYKEEDGFEKMDMKLIFSFLLTGLKTFLFKYLEIRYQLFTDVQLEEINIKGWGTFSNEFELPSNEEESKEGYKKGKKKKENFFGLGGDLRNIKFFEFYSAFEKLCKNVFSVLMKSRKKFGRKDKESLIDMMSMLKNFSQIKLKRFKEVIKSKKGFRSNNNVTNNLYELFFTMRDQELNFTEKKTRNLITNVKMKKRISLVEMEENEKEEDISENKSNIKEKTKKKKCQTEKKGKRRKENRGFVED